MHCPSCGDQTNANFCPACGSELGGGGEEQKKGGGDIGIGGTIVLAILFGVVSYFFIASNPRFPGWMRLPAWLSARDLAVPAPAPGVVVVPETSIPLPPPEPYEEVSSTKLSLSDYVEHELRIRLATEKTLADVDPLLRSRAKDLRRSAAVVRIRVYPTGSDATTLDATVATYIAVDLGVAHLPPEELAGMEEIEPGMFRRVQ